MDIYAPRTQPHTNIVSGSQMYQNLKKVFLNQGLKEEKANKRNILASQSKENRTMHAEKSRKQERKSDFKIA